MNEDELRERLRRLDPVPADQAIDPPTTPSSRIRLERIMNTEPAHTDNPAGTGNRTAADPPGPARTGPSRRLLAAVAAVATLVLAVGVLINVIDDDPDDDVAAGPPLELSLGSGDAIASCMAVDAAILADMAPAFAATATGVEGETVILEVDRWYAGGDAPVVELRAPGGMEALIAGFDFVEGAQYLITASGGTVNYCGYSGPATPELTALFDEAFG